MTETSGWYFDQYKYTYCCKYCGKPADERFTGGDPFEEPSFDYCPHCGMPMRKETEEWLNGFMTAMNARNAGT